MGHYTYLPTFMGDRLIGHSYAFELNRTLFEVNNNKHLWDLQSFFLGSLGTLSSLSKTSELRVSEQSGLQIQGAITSRFLLWKIWAVASFVFRLIWRQPLINECLLPVNNSQRLGGKWCCVWLITTHYKVSNPTSHDMPSSVLYCGLWRFWYGW